MTLSRRSALVCASAFAVGAADNAVASTARGLLNASVAAEPQTTQSFQYVLLHQDEAQGTPRYAYLAIPAEDSAWVALHDLDERAYRAASAKYASRGYRLRRVNAFQTRTGARYAAIWQLASGPSQLVRHGMTQAEFEAGNARDHALAHLDATVTPQGPRFAAIWEKHSAQQDAFAALTSAELTQTLAAMNTKGYRPRQIVGFGTRFAAVFEKGFAGGRETAHGLNADAFQAKSVTMRLAGYRMADATGYVVHGRPAFAAIWEKA